MLDLSKMTGCLIAFRVYPLGRQRAPGHIPPRSSLLIDGIVPRAITRWTSSAEIRTARETLTYSICLFQIQLRTVAGLTPQACAASLTVSIFAIRLPLCGKREEIVVIAMLYGQRMIFVEHNDGEKFPLPSSPVGL